MAAKKSWFSALLAYEYGGGGLDRMFLKSLIIFRATNFKTGLSRARALGREYAKRQPKSKESVGVTFLGVINLDMIGVMRDGKEVWSNLSDMSNFDKGTLEDVPGQTI
jgi:hypothetical protein